MQPVFGVKRLRPRAKRPETAGAQRNVMETSPAAGEGRDRQVAERAPASAGHRVARSPEKKSERGTVRRVMVDREKNRLRAGTPGAGALTGRLRPNVALVVPDVASFSRR